MSFTIAMVRRYRIERWEKSPRQMSDLFENPEYDFFRGKWRGDDMRTVPPWVKRAHRSSGLFGSMLYPLLRTLTVWVYNETFRTAFAALASSSNGQNGRDVIEHRSLLMVDEEAYESAALSDGAAMEV
jgi:hypothetical protein